MPTVVTNLKAVFANVEKYAHALPYNSIDKWKKSMISPYILSDFPLIRILVDKSGKSCPLIIFFFILSTLSEIITSLMDIKSRFHGKTGQSKIKFYSAADQI